MQGVIRFIRFPLQLSDAQNIITFCSEKCHKTGEGKGQSQVPVSCG